MLTCDVVECGEPRSFALGGIGLCVRHNVMAWSDLELRIRFHRPSFRCSASTQNDTACQGEGRPVEGLPAFIKLCAQHRSNLRDWNVVQRADEAERRASEMRAERAAQRKYSVVYFVERDDFVKIGTTANLQKRLQALGRGGQMPEGMTVGPVTLLASMSGDESNERFLHRQFAEHRIPRTEWFYPAPPLIEFVGGLKGRTPDMAKFRARLKCVAHAPSAT